MYCTHSQVGRSRVNKVREGLKNPPKSRELNKNDKLEHVKYRSSIPLPKRKYKTLGQIKKTVVTRMDHLFALQDDFLRDEMNLLEYGEYIQGKINDGKYYYRDLSSEDVAQLKKRYRRKVQEKNNRRGVIVEKNEFNKKQKNAYRKKRQKLINSGKSELINELFQKMKRSRSLGILKNNSSLSTDPSNWGNTKLTLFAGGSYIERDDKEWGGVYNKLNSMNTANIFDLQSNDDFHNLIVNQ